MTAKLLPYCLKCSLSLLFLLFFQVSMGQHDFSSVESFLTQQSKTLGKEVVVMVQKDGKNLYTHQQVEFTPKTATAIGSSSKWLTAAVIMIFVDEGKINLDDRVSKYIPLFEKYMKGYITIRHCLTHTSGIEADMTGLVKLAQRNKFASLEEEVNHYVTRRNIENNPAEVFNYGHVGPNIAARVIEVVSRKTFDRVAQEKLFRPVGMRNTSFYDEKGGVDPSYGAQSTAADLVNFMTMILQKGMHNGKRILSEASIEEMRKAQFMELPVKYRPKLMEGMLHGLGTWIEPAEVSGQPSLLSYPGDRGCWPWIDPVRGYVAVVLPKKTVDESNKKTYLDIRQMIAGLMQ